MTPNLTTLYLINSTLTHSKEFGYSGLGFSIIQKMSNLNNFFLCQFGAGMKFAREGNPFISPSFHHVHGIFFLCPPIKMFWVTADWIIASVANNVFPAYQGVVFFTSINMGVINFFHEAKHTIARCGSAIFPNNAIISINNFHFCIKAIVNTFIFSFPKSHICIIPHNQ